MKNIVLIDTSGSMCEEGKKSIIRYLINAIKGVKNERYPDKELNMYYWNEQIVPYSEKVKFEGKSGEKILKEFLDEHNDESILLIGDGNYSDDIRRIIKENSNRILFLMVGSECNKNKLGRVINDEQIFEAVDVVSCLGEFMNRQ